MTVAEAERSFSKLKLIKSTKPQERHSGLAVISINHAVAGQISSDVIDDFASRKARKVRVQMAVVQI